MRFRLKRIVNEIRRFRKSLFQFAQPHGHCMFMTFFKKHAITTKLNLVSPENLSESQFGLSSPYHGNQVFFVQNFDFFPINEKL